MNELEKFSKLKKDIQEISARKIRLEERFNTEKERLEKLLKEISEKGYDPKNLSETRQAKEKELSEAIVALEKGVQEASAKLAEIEGRV